MGEKCRNIIRKCRHVYVTDKKNNHNPLKILAFQTNVE